jgi:hypothetical protein
MLPAPAFMLLFSLFIPHAEGFARVPQFKVGGRVRVVKSTGGFYGQWGSILRMQPSAELDQLEREDPKFEILRGYFVKLDSGQSGFFAGIELEPE